MSRLCTSGTARDVQGIGPCPEKVIPWVHSTLYRERGQCTSRGVEYLPRCVLRVFMLLHSRLQAVRCRCSRYFLRHLSRPRQAGRANLPAHGVLLQTIPRIHTRCLVGYGVSALNALWSASLPRQPCPVTGCCALGYAREGMYNPLHKPVVEQRNKDHEHWSRREHMNMQGYPYGRS